MKQTVGLGRHRRFPKAAVVGACLAVLAGACGTNLSQAQLRNANGVLVTKNASGTAATVGGSSSAGDAGSVAASGGDVALGSAASGATGTATATGKAATGAATGGKASGTAAASGPGTKSKIVLGSLGTASGALGAVSGPTPPAIRAWVSYINAKGGLDGHPVEVLIADVAGDPVRTVSTARQFVEERGVKAFFNDFAFTEKASLLNYLESVNVPDIGTIGGDPSGDHSPMDFNPLTGPDLGDAWSFLMGPRTYTNKGKLGAIYCREAATCSAQLQSFDKLLPYDNNGVHQELVYRAQASLAQPDFTAEVIGAKQAGVEVLLVLMDTASVARIAQAAQRQNYAPIIAGTYNLNQDLILRYNNLDGVLLTSRTPPWDSSPKMAFYRDAMARYQPNTPMGDLGGGVFVVGALLEKYAHLLPANPTSADWLNMLYSIHGETLNGLLPGITFNHGEHVNVNQCTIPMKLSGGKFTAHDAAESFVCAPNWKPGT